MKKIFYTHTKTVFLCLFGIPLIINQGFAGNTDLPHPGTDLIVVPDHNSLFDEIKSSKFSDLNVSGRVISSADGEGIPGVSILIKNATIGSVTDVEGNYNITLPSGNEILIFSSIGFVTQEVVVNGRTVIDITLDEDMQNLDEVVVVGYSSKQLSQLSSSVAVVSGESLND